MDIGAFSRHLNLAPSPSQQESTTKNKVPQLPGGLYSILRLEKQGGCDKIAAPCITPKNQMKTIYI